MEGKKLVLLITIAIIISVLLGWLTYRFYYHPAPKVLPLTPKEKQQVTEEVLQQTDKIQNTLSDLENKAKRIRR